MTSLVVLQAVRLKGRVSRTDLAATPGEIEELIEAGWLLDGPALRLSPQGRGHLDELLRAERSGLDGAAIARVYRDFGSVNTEFKALVTDWQVRDGRPNSHDDADYDAAVVARLDAVHRTVLPIVDAAAGQLPRLSGYATKLQAALDNIHAGETAWLSRPLMDSYHTVWFELHEELILAAGRTRDREDA